MAGSGITQECYLRAAGTQSFDRKRNFYHLQIGRWKVNLMALPEQLRSFYPLLLFLFFHFKCLKKHLKKQNCNAFKLSESQLQSQGMLQDTGLKKISTCLWHVASIYSTFLQCLWYILCIMEVIYLKGFKSEQHIVGSLQINVVHHQLPWSQLHKDG